MFMLFPLLLTCICFAESVWGRYFENNKVEGTINTDLARLYPEEHGSFFQSKTCQAILKRVLLVWALIHPQYGYQQGTMKNDYSHKILYDGSPCSSHNLLFVDSRNA